MQTRNTILSLVAAGRITAAEAERLLAVWNQGRESLWIAIGCVGLCLGQVWGNSPLTGLEHGLRRAWGMEWGTLHRMFEMVKAMGGRL